MHKEIDREIIDRYLHRLTMGRASNHQDPMAENMTLFDADIRDMHRRAKRDDRLEELREAMESLINFPDERIKACTGMQYPFEDEEVVLILQRAYSQIWPELKTPSPIKVSEYDSFFELPESDEDES